MEGYDVVVVGAGPAGLCLTRELAGSELKVLLIDRKRDAGDVRYNTSGSFIDPVEWGLPDEVLHPVYKTRFISRNEEAIKEGIGYIIDRRKLLEFLEEESRENENLEVMYRTWFRSCKFGKRGIEQMAVCRDGEDVEVAGKTYVDCSGNSCIIGRHVGLKPARTDAAVGAEYLVPLKTEPHTADLFVGSNLRGGYGWIFPTGDDKAIVGYGSLNPEYYPKVRECLDGMWEMGRVSERCEHKPLEENVAVFTTGEPLRKFTERNVVAVGDCVLQGNPLVGEGIRFVMDSARMAARWIIKALEEGDNAILEGYSREWAGKYHKKYRIAYMLQQKMRRYTDDDRKLDFIARRMAEMSNQDFKKGLSGDFTTAYMLKMGIKSAMMKARRSWMPE
ncbi:MAG: FAD-dependent oxidoreductase [Candidatus Altiarchaeales archaeon]|nr:FAD-dependent oxidoreductase [Candidatus Altiarchaeales archaeon]MBD3416822.1 FAD-dependent oxidoreductase [Candidatus Altiarchaeales archaeon]